jgi:hypothetical protein
MKGNIMNIFESLENLNVSEECFDEIMEKVDNILHTGHPEKEDNKYIVTSAHDNGELKTQVHAPSAEAARNAVNNVEGGPKRAHQVLVKDNPERTAEEVKRNSKVVGVSIGHRKTAQTNKLKELGVDKLTNKKLSESLVEEIMGIVEEFINELKDSTVDSMYQKRKDIERKADRKANYAHTVGETALTKAKNSGDKEAAKNIQKFIDNADDEQRKTTSKRLKAQRTISNWARKKKNININFDANGHPYITK